MAYNLLKGKKGIIFGALNEMSIAWQVAEKCIEEGAEIVLTNTPLSIRMGDIQDFAAKHQIPLIPADATSVEDLTHLFQESMTHFGGKVDFILHSIGMSLNVRKKRPYDDLDYDFCKRRWIYLQFLSIKCCKRPKNWTPSMSGDRWSLCLMWQLSVRCSNTTTWPMQKLCWNR